MEIDPDSFYRNVNTNDVVRVLEVCKEKCVFKVECILASGTHHKLGDVYWVDDRIGRYEKL